MGGALSGTRMRVPSGCGPVPSPTDIAKVSGAAVGRRQLAREVEIWDRLSSLIARLRGAEQG
jgi:hypothetical protein